MSGSNIIKVFFGFVFATVSLAANAQFHLGGEFSINYSNEHTSYFSGTSKDREDAFLISLKPKIYWNVGENMQAIVSRRESSFSGNAWALVIFKK